MKWTTATALFLALGAAGVGVTIVATRKPRSAESVIETVKRDMADDKLDEASAIRLLDRTLEGANRDEQTTRELLRLRSSLFERLGAYDRARADLERFSDNEDPSVLAEIAKLQDLEGQTREALERARFLNQKFPNYGEGWQLRGALEESVAMKAVDEAMEIARIGLNSDDARTAGTLIRGLTAKAVEDPTKEDLSFQLGELFRGLREAVLNDVLERVRTPRQEFSRARNAFATALSHQVSPQTITQLAASFERAGRRDLGIQLALAARSEPSVSNDADAVAALLDDLIQADRLAEARSILKNWDWQQGGSLEFYRSAGEVFYKAGDYALLPQVARGLKLVGGDLGAQWGSFFRAIWPIEAPIDPTSLEGRLSNTERLLPSLRDFAKDDQFPEPFLGAKNDAWFFIANAYRMIGSLPHERLALNTALKLQPKASADAWIRYAETLREAKQVRSWSEIEEALSNAMDLAPERTDVLRDQWYEAGRKALEKHGSTLKAIQQQVSFHDQALPLTTVGPSVMTSIAQYHLDNGHPHRAIRAAQRALTEYPNLIPARDVEIDAQLGDQKRYNVARSIVERIELAGIDSRVEGFTSRLNQNGLRGQWLVRAVRAAPIRFGKTAVARWHLRRGDTARAGAALTGIDDATSPPELRMLRAELLVQGEEFDSAIVELDRVGDAPQLAPRSYELRIEAMIGAGRSGPELAQVTRRMVTALPAEAPEFLTVIDQLMNAGRIDLAVALVDRLDQNTETRNAAFYRRRVVVDLLASDATGVPRARESIIRAEPYLSSGVPELASILLAIHERDWVLLRSEVERLGRSAFEPTVRQATAIALLGERLEAGRRAAKSQLEASPRDPISALIAGAADTLVGADIELPEWFGPTAEKDLERLMRGIEQRSARDPREALGLLLISASDTWLPYSKSLTASIIEDSKSEIWAPWLRVQLLMTEGKPDEAADIVQQILGGHPQFGPAHDLAVQIAVSRHPTEPLHPSVVRARTDRVGSLKARLVGDEIECQIAIAGESARQGNYAFAAESMLPVIRAGGPSETEGRLMLSLFELRAGQPGLAARHLKDAAMNDVGVYRVVAIDTLLTAIQAAIKVEGKDGLSQKDALGMLDDLAVRYPHDPIVALRRLQLQDVSEGEKGSRARGILRRIRSAAGDRPLDELREGATSAWVNFLSPIASEVAEELVESELELEPGNLNMLALAGEIAEQRGDSATARANYRTLLSIDPRPETGYALARIMIEDGANNDDVRSVLNEANRRQGGGSAKATYLTSVYEMRLARPPLGSLIPRLKSLWSQRVSSRDEVDPLDLGMLYADALMRRGTEDDLATLLELAGQMEPFLQDTYYEPTLLRALQGIAKLGLEK